MKLAILLMCAGIFQASAVTIGQTVTLNKKNAKMSSVLKEIQQQTGYNIFYDSSLIPETLLVSLSIQKQALEPTLKQLFKKYDLHYSIVDKNIILKKGERFKNNQLENERDLRQISVSGTVKAATGEVLANVSIVQKGNNNSVMTDENGDFTIQLNGTDAVLVFSFVGYENQEITVGNRNSIQVLLKPSTTNVDEVVVVGYGTQKKVNMTGAVSSVDMDALSDRPLTNATKWVGRIGEWFIGHQHRW